MPTRQSNSVAAAEAHSAQNDRRTGILVRGIHLAHVADNLTEDDAYPRMDIGLQDPAFDSAILNHLQEEADALGTNPWEGII